MQRYGYEGFPVVIDGQVIGLLTRRAVDRALSHKLNLPAASLMDAGEVFVQSPGFSAVSTGSNDQFGLGADSGCRFSKPEKLLGLLRGLIS